MKNYSLFLDNPFCVVGGRRKGEGGNCESVLFLLWKQYSGRKLPPFGEGKRRYPKNTLCTTARDAIQIGKLSILFTAVRRDLADC